LSDSGVSTYGKKLQSLVRTDPDIIGVADCEDTETAQVAAAAALSGKLVYVTLEEENVLRANRKMDKACRRQEQGRRLAGRTLQPENTSNPVR